MLIFIMEMSVKRRKPVAKMEEVWTEHMSEKLRQKEQAL
jgi:hypothetical protein